MAKIHAGIVALAAKLGPKLLAIVVKLAKVVKVGKFGLAIGSMAAYVYLFTWQFAILVMISLFFHESGHIWAMKRCGLKTKGIYFIPFLGAAAVSEEMFKTRRDEVYVAIMGPIWGFALAVGTALVYVLTGNALFAAAAGWMAMVNLFNLLPVNPLDGGRIMKSIAFSINSKMGFIFLVIGIIISTILTLWAGMILFVFLLFIGSLELFFEYREYEVRPSMTHRGSAISAIAYVVVIAALWALMSYTSHIPEVDIAMKLFMS
jgi:Zn-dependent protease